MFSSRAMEVGHCDAPSSSFRFRPSTKLRQVNSFVGAIFKAAGIEKFQAVCLQLDSIKPGEAVITEGFDLSTRYSIRTLVPKYSEWSHEQSEFFVLHI